MKSKLFEVFIPGIPVAQPRPRFKPVTKRNITPQAIQLIPGIGAYNPDNGVKRWKSTVAVLVNSTYSGKIIEGKPVGVSLGFWLPPPAWVESVSGPFAYGWSKPDLDNLEKAVLDAITQTKSVWVDDCQVAYVEKMKIFGSDSKRVGLSLAVYELENPTIIRKAGK